MRILFIGCVKSSELFLRKLLECGAEIVGVITKQESKINADFVDLGKICQEYKIDFLYVKSANDGSAKDYMKSKNVDLILCLGWSQILDAEVLSIPRLGSIGFHPAALPHNRGRHPLIWALALGLEETASTFFLMDETADTGQIISQRPITIDYLDDAASLYDKIMETAVVQLEELLHNFQNGSLKIVPQSMEIGNVWRKRGKDDVKIDWRMSSNSIYNLVRALTKPYVGAHFVYKAKEYKVWKVREVRKSGYENIEPGKVVQVMSGSNFTVKAGENLIEILDCEDTDIKIGDYL